MASFLKTQTEWNIYWTSYRGRVRVVDRYGSVEYGETTGETFAEQYQEPGMAVLLDSGKEIWTHPDYVQPVEYADSWEEYQYQCEREN